MAIKQTLIRPLVMASLLVGCKAAHKIHDPEYHQLTHAARQAWHAQEPIEDAVNPVYDELTGSQPVEMLINFALSQNAGVQAARKRVEAAAMQVPQAASLMDPMLSVSAWPFYPNVPQTAAGRVTAEVMVSQEVPWFGKLQAQSEAAEAETNMARAKLAAGQRASGTGSPATRVSGNAIRNDHGTRRTKRPRRFGPLVQTGDRGTPQTARTTGRGRARSLQCRTGSARLLSGSDVRCPMGRDDDEPSVGTVGRRP